MEPDDYDGRRFMSAAPAIVAALLCAAPGCAPMSEIQPEIRTTLRVGELAAVRVDSDRDFSVGSAGESLTLMKRTEQGKATVYVYRAVAVGNQTLVLTPREPGADGCISCVTVHYFVTVHQ